MSAAKSLKRGSTFADRGEGLKRTAPLKSTSSRPRRQTFTPASDEQRAKVSVHVCAVVECQRHDCDPAHLTPRSFRGCDHPACVIALCREHHRQFDDGRLDLLPHLAARGFEAELAHMQGHYSDPLSVIFRLSGMRWAPETEFVSRITDLEVEVQRLTDRAERMVGRLEAEFATLRLPVPALRARSVLGLGGSE